MLCHYQLLVCYLSCLVVDCWSSTSEYLIIRHGRSRVRHSSEKDHIRWGLQVFDNFTLLDYDTVDDSNETMSGSGAGGSHKSPSPRTNGRPGGGGQFLDNGNNSDTLTIQFSESEELDRMIDISDFDSISTSRRQSKNNRTLNFPFGVDSAQSSTRFAPVATPMPPVLPPTKPAVQQSKKLIKKEIMENIRKTVDKGLEYLKSHKNLDEVKIELKPFRERPRHVPGGGRSIDAETTTHEKVIPSHDRFFDERRKNEPKHVEEAGFDGNRKEHIQVSSLFSSTSTETPTGQDLDDEGGFQSVAYLEEKYWKSVKINDDPDFPAKHFPASTRDDKDYPNDFPPAQHASSDSVPLDTLNEASPEQQRDKKIVLSMEAIKSETGSENNAQQQKFNYDQQKQTLHPLLTLQNDGPVDEVGVPDGDEVINILNDTPAMNFDPNGAPATMIFSSDPDSSDPDSPPVWVADAGNPVDDSSSSSSYGTGGSAAVVVETGDIFHMDDLDLNEMDETSRNNRRNLMRGRDVVTQFLWIVESQHLLGSNCTAGTALNLGEGVVDQYAQDRFRVEAEIAVNRANMLTRIFKFASPDVQASEHLLHASVLSMVEFDDDIFAAGNCFDWNQHPAKNGLFCPFAYRLPPPDQGASLAKDLAAEYHYLGNTSEWFFLARKNAEKVIARNEQYIKLICSIFKGPKPHFDPNRALSLSLPCLSPAFHIYSNNTARQADEILSVKYEDGRWSKPYYDCGGGNIWMLTYTVPFFGYENGTYFFKGTSGIDIDLRRVDIDQCPQRSSPSGAPQPLNIFAGTDKCKQRTTECIAIPGLGFRRGSYRCVCRKGFYFPDTSIEQKWFNGTTLEEEYEKLMLSEFSTYNDLSSYECLPCAEGCDSCLDASPCVAALNWTMRTGILVLACTVIGLLPPAAVFTFRYQQVKSIVMYPPPSLYTCTARVWLREIGFSLTYGALMLKTWRISVIFRVRSAKAVKITDAYLLKRLGLLCGFVGIALLVRTLVAPPVVIVGRTADNLKAFLCKTDWWDHTFTSMNEGRLTEEEATEEIKQLYNQLQRLYDRIPQRGTAIATLAALMETCKNVSLKPPPTIVPKAIMPAPQENGLIRVDKSTNTNSIPNGKFGSNTRITITDDSDHHLNNNHRSIDNSSNFNLDSLQLKCMCSEEEVLDGEPKCECHKGGAAEVPSCTNTVRSSCKSSVCCDSGRRELQQEEPGGERSKSLLVKRNSELMLNSSSSSSCCRDGSGRNGSARQPVSGGASCSSKFSELCPKNFESCDNLLHQQQKQRQKQTSCGDSIDNHSNRRPLPGESGLVTTASSLSVDENNFRNVNLENFNKLYASHNNKIDSLKENFLMRTALTTALHNLENENRSRGHRNTHGEPSAAASSCQCTVPNPSCSTCGRPSSSSAATVQSAGNSASESISSADASSSATATEANGGSTGRDPAKKKKSPEKRLVIDLNDRSKYTEEVSV
ncbi:hypothetical protein quinque_002587 [Culex quinquefasciatus]